MKKTRAGIVIIFIFLTSSVFAQWNNPHSENKNKKIMYGAFVSAPKTLDPARAYSSDETQLIAQIYEPPLQYAYLKRPYQLIPLTLKKMPTITYVKKNGEIIYTIYDLQIKKGIYYQPHPAFANNIPIHNPQTLNDFKKTGTRELTAQDYVYQIKRLASPTVNSPIFGVMENHIVGLKGYAKTLQNAYQAELAKGIKNPYLDLRQFPLSGVTIVNRYEYQIKIYGKYPQFLYWLAMPFFAPIPWEADLFYSNPALKENNITLDWYPIGTGPYLLKENNPNQKMVLEKNPHFRGEPFPNSTHLNDQISGYTKNAGEIMPFVDQLVLTLDKESVPRWNKFLQGYYDRSGISADSFDQAIQLDKNGIPILTQTMRDKGIRLQTTINPSVFYIGFNMQDDVVGGLSEKNKKLRQAIAIAIDYEEYIQLFLNGRGIPAQSPIPPGIFGYEKNHINKAIYFWDKNHARRKPLSVAKKLLAQAGYPNGINPKTGKPLVLNYDVTSSGNPDDRSQLNWMRKQFAKLGIALNIRQTEYNRFQDKVRNGNAQIFSWGWLADYPDPENFLFLLYSANGKVKHGGENASNYNNPQFDLLFNEMKSLPNGKKRLEKIRELLALIQNDTPWVWGFHPIDFTLSHSWVENTKPHAIANNTLKYQNLDPTLRAQLQKKWNKPVLWPLWVLLGFLVLIFIPLVVTYWRREQTPSTKKY
ncbi:MAG: peptide ABC transporter substrate-binding protein [Gammaproteobacteria bacterium CG_4_9_14_3_um_filter_38_9]|nr:MAG: peptide ABC transporter substrate-binding protein [Gammaproteobacteria bacterium CG_4_9_14_3_um_filter_38_9]